jgi:hypothetical protein
VSIWIGVGVALALMLSAGVAMAYRARKRRPPAGAVRVRLQQRQSSKGVRSLQLVALRKPASSGVNGQNGFAHPAARMVDHQPELVAPGDETAGGTSAPIAPIRAPRSSDPPGRRNEQIGQAARAVQADLAIRERIESEDDPGALFEVGVTLYEAGDRQGARDAWQRAMERGHRRAAVNLGFLLQRMGDRRAAREAYLKAAEWGDPVAARLAEGLRVRSDKAHEAN